MDSDGGLDDQRSRPARAIDLPFGKAASRQREPVATSHCRTCRLVEKLEVDKFPIDCCPLSFVLFARAAGRIFGDNRAL